MKIYAYPLYKNAQEIKTGNSKREWMDNSTVKYAYRCLPLNIANSYGWYFESDAEFNVTWDGGNHPDSVKIEKINGVHFPISLFGEGTFTFHLGYLFKTEYPYGLYVTGTPNYPKPNVIPLSGVVETHWLPFTFTMNWKFTQPGQVNFKPGDVICHIFPVNLEIFEQVTPEIRSFDDDPEFYKQYKDWSQSRNQFSADLNAGKFKNNEWQKFYFQGKYPPDGIEKCPFHTKEDGEQVSTHRTNLNVPKFIDVTEEPK